MTPSKGLKRGINDLKTINPDLAAEWHPTKNGDLKPTDVTASSNKKVWWICRQDGFVFEWQAKVYHRNAGQGCPYLSNKAVLKGYNDLESIYPDLAAEWHPATMNGWIPLIIVRTEEEKERK